MVALYGVTIFLSAALLFLVQPMFTRLVLPLLGGSPAVWNTAMVFFQAALLAGYAYAHAATERLGARRQAVLHLLILLLPLAFLPLAIPADWTPPTQDNPIPWLLVLMTATVGLPFFALSTTAPVLQKWFAATRHRDAGDPYFLYAASNVGSMLALLSYPLVVERVLPLGRQGHYWALGYGAWVGLVFACAIGLWRSQPTGGSAAIVRTGRPAPEKIPLRRRLRWGLWAFVPTSLMLSVTTFLSSDVAVVPLMWVVPLALYLLTFILVFARRSLWPPSALARAFPILVVALALLFNLQAAQPIAGLMLLHLAAFFVAAMLCHGKLAADRPGPAQLTTFYLWMSLGGVLGGVFNALIAPLVFDSIAEYPLTLVLACAVGLSGQGAKAPAESGRWGDWLWPLLLGLATAGLLSLVESTRFRAHAVVTGVLLGTPALLCYCFSRRPARFALGVGAFLLAGRCYLGEQGRALFAERSFFGTHRVTLDPVGNAHLLVHGKTLHGRQSLDPARRREPLTYYHRTGPIGQTLAAYGQDPQKKIAAIGLGAGSLASYAQPGQSWTYYEIDPVVFKIARDERFFTFLRDSPANLRVVLGDARVSLMRTEESYDLMILDAFSSDAIPAHLVTREALALYLRRLAPGGLLAFHISNLHLDLEPVFADLARDASLVCLIRDDTAVPPAEQVLGKSPSLWLVMARDRAELAKLIGDSRWQLARGRNGRAIWTDDYSSLLSVFRW